MNSKWLLPNGLVDLLPDEAEKEAYAIQNLMKEFASFGYRRVKPPLVEFEESLISGPGQGLSRQTFRLMDPISQQMMGLRADLTPQIARLASSRFGADEKPLRLCYAGDVLRVKGSQLRPERQFCQVGCELIGSHDAEADIEMILLPVIALSTLGIKELSIDMTLPALIRLLFETEDMSEELLQALDNKDKRKVSALKPNHTDFLLSLMDLSGNLEEDLKTLSRIDVPDSAAKDIERLMIVAKGVLRALMDLQMNEQVQLTLDPLERSQFTYHNGVAFTLFQKGARGELGRGGRYSFDASEIEETAIGFTLYMDSVRRIIPDVRQTKTEEVDKTLSWKEIRDMQSQGLNIIRKI